MSSKRADESPLEHGKPAVTPEAYRRACSRFATGITVVTVVDAEGRPHGVTMNSFSSVSLDPPLVLVSLDLKSALLGHFLTCKGFAINVLRDDHEHLSRRFASTAADRFEGVAWHPGESGYPLLEGMIAHFECRRAQHFEVGDHTVLIGEVLRVETAPGKPLLYFDSGYREIGEKPETAGN